jgi:adenosylcobinamide-GDP ribazoletransferase
MSGATEAGGERRPGPFDRFLSAFTLASRISVRRPFVYDQSRIDFHLPLVGAVVAVPVGAVLALCAALGASPAETALAVLVVQYGAFNLFHLDGFMDSADALLGAGSQERRLEILKDSRIGVYAFFAGFCLLAAKLLLLRRVAALWGPGPAPDLDGVALAALLSYPVSGRAAAALVPALLEPARKNGLGAQAAGASVRRVGLGAFCAVCCVVLGVGAAAGALLSAGASGSVPAGAATALRELCLFLAVPLAAAAGAFAVARAYKRGIGGYTGDALGAAVETGEALHLALFLTVLGVLG